LAHEYNFEYAGDNSIITYPEPCPQLDPLGADDVIRTRAVVVGGLSPDASMAYVSYLREAGGRQDRAARMDWLRSSAVLWRQV